MASRSALAVVKGLDLSPNRVHALPMEIDDVIRDLTAAQYGLVGRNQLHAAGIDGDAIAHRVGKRQLEPLSPEVLRLLGAPHSREQRAMAGVLDAPPGAVLSHGSAAAWWGIPGFDLDGRIHVTVPHQGARIRSRLAVIHFHRALPAEHLASLGGMPVTSPTLTIFLLAGTVSPRRTERALDNMAAMGLGSYRSLHDLLPKLAERGRNGIALIRILLDERPPDQEPPGSGTERRAEQLASQSGICLRRQVNVGGVSWDGRVDFVLGDFAFALIEIMSRRHHGMLLDRRSDEDRIAGYQQDGFIVLVLWEDEVWYQPWIVKQKLAAFYAEAVRTAAERGQAPPQTASGAPTTTYRS